MRRRRTATETNGTERSFPVDLRRQEPIQPREQAFRVARLALPHHENPPAGLPQQANVPPVTLCVPVELPSPERRVGSRPGAAAPAGVTMPPASMNENHLAVTRQHDVRTAGKVASVQAESIPHRVHEPTDDKLRRRVPAADARHAVRSLLRREDIQFASLLRVCNGNPSNLNAASHDTSITRGPPTEPSGQFTAARLSPIIQAVEPQPRRLIPPRIGSLWGGPGSRRPSHWQPVQLGPAHGYRQRTSPPLPNDPLPEKNTPATP